MVSKMETTYSFTAFKFSIASLLVFVVTIGFINANPDASTVLWFAIIVGGIFSFCGTIYSVKGFKEKGGFGKWFALLLNILFLIVFIFFLVGYFFGAH